MPATTFLTPILDSEALTRGLGDAEARLLVEWLVEQAEAKHAAGLADDALAAAVADLCRRARAVARFVFLWCYQHSHGAAVQLAGAERFAWPLPCDVIDPYDLLLDILCWDGESADVPEGVEGAGGS
jgi:hypothetical protein